VGQNFDQKSSGGQIFDKNSFGGQTSAILAKIASFILSESLKEVFEGHFKSSCGPKMARGPRVGRPWSRGKLAFWSNEI
jgi:hypothetical protein